ncbi:erythromycin esterase family protein [Streptomyces sp. NPDC048434]|uniref:erythromycin esterase family protein n=1 Tax=Streptomyces sp. NPDC048434 TaxID=3365549 RepID=UPI00371E275F
MNQYPTALVLALLLGTATAGAPPNAAAVPGPAASDTSTALAVEALERGAHPLRTVEPQGDTSDLRPLDRMIGDARAVGIGEATHSSHDFFALKRRIFRHLVAEKGFRTFALEASWSTGLRLDDYVLHGKGDPRRIMSDEFQRDYLWWNNTDYLRLIEWMRAYNVRHPHDPVRFMGDDIGWTGPEVYDAVTDYVARTHPGLNARFDGLYRGLRPTVATGKYMDHYLDMPYAERKEMADRTGRALRLLTRQSPGADRAAFERAVQNATAIDQTARQYAFDFDDPAQLAAGMRYRDRAMAANVVRWQQRTGTKVLLSAHDAHVAYQTQDPAHYPRMQGAFLRESLGPAYVSVGLSFDQGSFNATGPDGAIRRRTLGPAGRGSNERTLDRVRYRDYAVDLRTVGSPARAWLAAARPTRSIGTEYPDGPHDVALGRSYDILIHLHHIEAARLLNDKGSARLGTQHR